MCETYIRLNPVEHPLIKGESWWIVHPNSAGAEFIIPARAITACLKDFMDFKKGTLYSIRNAEEDGWVDVIAVDTLTESNSIEKIICMPQYIFARYFDAEVFVRGINNAYIKPRFPIRYGHAQATPRPFKVKDNGFSLQNPLDIKFGD